VKIAEGLSEGQVLQRRGRRGATARVIGECATSGPVFATLATVRGVVRDWRERKVGLARAGRFSATLANVPIGGPYRLTLRCGTERARVEELYCGDVWLLAGQSNMEGVGNMSGAAEPHPLVRVFSLARVWRRAEDPLHVLPESPDPCHHVGKPATPAEAERLRRTAKKGVGVGVFFAREMFARSGVPQGLIATAHGGTSMAQWDPALKGRGGESLYGSMLLSLRATGQPVAGVLWYQGESDTRDEEPDLYTDRMRALVAAVRRDLKQPALPWIMAQIGAVYGDWGGPRWNDTQEQQRLLPKRIRHLDLVSAVDLPLDDYIHIAAEGFPVLAARMARVADRLVLRNRREAPMPRLRKIVPPSPKRPHIDVVFANVPGGLRAAGLPRGFTVLDGEGRELPCVFKTTLLGDRARLHLAPDLVPGAEHRLAYGHGKTPDCNITDGRGCALPVFGPLPFVKNEGRLAHGVRSV